MLRGVLAEHLTIGEKPAFSICRRSKVIAYYEPKGAQIYACRHDEFDVVIPFSKLGSRTADKTCEYATSSKSVQGLVAVLN